MFAFLLFTANKSNSFVFLENLRLANLLFEINWPLQCTYCQVHNCRISKSTEVQKTYYKNTNFPLSNQIWYRFLDIPWWSLFLVFLTCTDELHHFDTATFTIPKRRHILFVNGIIERIMTSRIIPRVTFETIYYLASYSKRKNTD